MNQSRLVCLLLILLLMGAAQRPAQESEDRQSVEEIKAKAEKGDAGAQVNLGNCYAEGRGVPQDNAEAVKWFRKAADQGNAGAQVNLGSCYAEGLGAYSGANRTPIPIQIGQ